MINWVLKKFDELLPLELYAIMQLRNEVFVVEQNCVYQDADNKDIQSHHLCGWSNATLVAYSRILPTGLAYEKYSSIGRVVNSPKYRGTGIGKELVSTSITHTKKLYLTSNIKIGAQLYLKKFYESFGFEQIGDEYLEDNIPHIPMLLKK
ncbi:MAG: GNAT family N-acetyltransferase [Ferruginibacter sp.]|nr:GNAT family N-acetyltransferase [Ferruginibacter sp.]